ncbi:MAG TPA: hypothetical protein VF937_11590 [Chloroflexota bacterium]
MDLGSSERTQMLSLLHQHFSNVTAPRFARDLAEKEWAILLADRSGDVRGFSTLMRLRLQVGADAVVAFFSGDTIVHPDYWGEGGMPQLWARHVFRLAGEVRDARVYWFLVSSGYRTYRFLPVFFRAFFPSHASATPGWEKAVLDALGRHKYPREYDASRGIVRPRYPTPLRDGLAEVSAHRLADPHVAFFLAANPGYAHGDELACLAALEPNNLTRAGRRMLWGPDATPPADLPEALLVSQS